MKTSMKTQNCLMFTFLALFSLAKVSSAGQPLTLVPAATIEIPNSTGKFDFLRIDPKRGRLLAAHENDGTADYIDMRKNVLITRLKVGGAVDTAVDSDSKLYYVSVQEAQRVAIVEDRKSTRLNSSHTDIS